MTIEKLELPVGRIVNGNPAVAEQKTNFQTGEVVIKNGIPVTEWRCSLAIPKDVFMRDVYPKLVEEAGKVFPNGVGADFSWKVVDGDSPATPKRSKVPYNVREGYPGHFILKLSTEAFAPPIYKNENGQWRQLAPHEIKCGDYVVANIQVKAHANNDGGLYLNPNGFNHVGYGKEIASLNTTPETMFAGKYTLPPDASVMPVAPAMGMPAMPAAAPAMGMPAPAYDFLQNAGVQSPFAANAANPPVTGVPQGNGFATSATPSPFNQLPPGIPAAR